MNGITSHNIKQKCIACKIANITDIYVNQCIAFISLFLFLYQFYQPFDFSSNVPHEMESKPVKMNKYSYTGLHFTSNNLKKSYSSWLQWITKLVIFMYLIKTKYLYRFSFNYVYTVHAYLLCCL